MTKLELRKYCASCREYLPSKTKGITWHETLVGYPTHKSCDDKFWSEQEKRTRIGKGRGTDDFLRGD